MNTRNASFILPLLLVLSATWTLRAAASPQPEWAAPGALTFTYETLRKTLPLRGDRLAAGKPYDIVAIGDAVTGPYPEILARLLQRATGNNAIAVSRAAYSGKCTDSAVRRYARDIESRPCDLALIMFGLNDQGAFAPLDTYADQIAWLIARLRARGADVILLEPTPHINITPRPGDKQPPPPAASIFRTITFAGALRALGEKTRRPVAPAFDALWRAGAAADLQQTARNLWPYFPQQYKKNFSSLVETNGIGDTIHPNVRGHFLIARAIFDTIAATPHANPLHITARTQWKQSEPKTTTTATPAPTTAAPALITQLTLANTSTITLTGTLALYPFVQDDLHETYEYTLHPGEKTTRDFTWPAITEPDDLLTSPHNHVFGASTPIIQVVDYTDNRNTVRPVEPPFEPPDGFIRERAIAENNRATARLRIESAIEELTVPIPENSHIGRIMLSRTITLSDHCQIPITTELAYVRYAAAPTGEAIIDDWPPPADATAWFPVGEPVQARLARGQSDSRKTPAECYTHWSIKAGREGVWLAFRATGDISRDSFTIFFDPRPPAELGAAGPFTWIDGSITPDGKIILKPSDTYINTAAKRDALYKTTDTPGGPVTTAEIFVPYDILGITAWPESGDLGLSIVWNHPYADGRVVTRLLWPDNGYRWSPHWFGVARRDPALLCMVRIQ